jgi:hypothetical protein
MMHQLVTDTTRRYLCSHCNRSAIATRCPAHRTDTSDVPSGLPDLLRAERYAQTMAEMNPTVRPWPAPLPRPGRCPCGCGVTL